MYSPQPDQSGSRHKCERINRTALIYLCFLPILFLRQAFPGCTEAPGDAFALTPSPAAAHQPFDNKHNPNHRPRESMAQPAKLQKNATSSHSATIAGLAVAGLPAGPAQRCSRFSLVGIGTSRRLVIAVCR